MRCLPILAFGVLTACHDPAKPDDTTQPSDSSHVVDTTDSTPPGDSSGDTSDTTVDLPPVEVVLFLTLDATERHFYGINNDWNTSPTLDALFADSVVIPDAVSPRSLTTVSLTALHTARYPRTTGVRANPENGQDGDPLPADVPDVFKIFHDAGWYTASLSSNQCGVDDYYPKALDRRVCTSAAETELKYTQAEADQILVDETVDLIDAYKVGQKLFLRVHLVDDHWPYNRVDPYLAEFFPETYGGLLDVENSGDLNRAMLDTTPITEEERLYLHAVYASQLRGLDDKIKVILDKLDSKGLMDKTMIVFGSDHGDELAQNGSNYMYHGCSFKNTVLGALYAFKRPGLPAGRLEGHISTIDMLPTLLQLAGLPADAGQEGVSLVPNLFSFAPPERPVYYERGADTAGVVLGNITAAINPDGDYEACTPYQGSGHFYHDSGIEIFDLESDPYELTNLKDFPTDETNAALDQACTWVLSAKWAGFDVDDANNVVVQYCQERG